MSDVSMARKDESGVDDVDVQVAGTVVPPGAQPVDTEQSPRLPFVVVGIGASAGGLEAVSELLAAMPADARLAFVLVQHLPPDRESMMAELLGKRTAMPVREVEDGVAVEPGQVYVIRPGHVLTLREGKLRLGATLGGPRAADRPVDDFFKSLAAEQRERAVCVVMSGMGSNGTAGAQAVKAVGGLSVAQEPESAKFPSMPRHLIDSGNADHVLRPAEMPAVLLAYAAHPYARGGADTGLGVRATRSSDEEATLREVLSVLRNRARADFGGYKPATLLRRVQRRMGLTQLTDGAEYVRRLRQSPAEVAALADDLLIHVTGFFRDPEAWEALRERVVAPLVASREPGSDVRCWVTACSTGDEAYSLAILLSEEAERVGKPMEIKVFATDMADRTLARARAGLYPGGIEAEVSAERLARFFVREDAVYRVRPEVRERVVFAPQNVLQDPPFSGLDIVTCRNLLIYLRPDVQRRVLGLLHFGLRDGGALFLGSSESVPGDDGMFETLDKRARIFRRVGPTRHTSIEFPLPRGLVHTRRADEPSTTEPPEPRGQPRPTWAQVTQRTLIDLHLPSAALVDREHRVVYLQGDTRPYLSMPAGEPTRDLGALASEGLRAAVRVALRRAATEGGAATVREGWVEPEPGTRRRVHVTASPAVGAEGHFVVSFATAPGGEGGPPDPAEGSSVPAGDRNLADELRRVRAELRATAEELQRTHEEMRAAAEEASSVNEELQSTNEELETSKEEMQSLNEELSTVNAQLRAKMEELQETGNDLTSLLSSTDIAVLFLDPGLRVRRFTPKIRALLELLPSDVGRPLADFALKFDDPHLAADARSVLERLVPAEREVAAADGRSYLRRITPYRTTEDRIDGVVVAFIDITERVRAAERLAEIARLLDLSHDAIIIRDRENRITYWNHGASTLFGWSAEEAVGKDLHALLRTEFELPYDQLISELHRTDRLAGEIVQTTRDGRRLTLLCRWAHDRQRDGGTGSILTTATDITGRKAAELEIANARAEAEAANGVKDRFLSTLSHELRTPLSAILLWTRILLDDRDRSNMEEGLHAIHAGAEAQRILIDDLLDTSRIAAGKVRLQPREVNLAGLVHDAVETVRPLADVRGVAVASDLAADVGIASVDPDRMRQVVWNLVNNAVKFTPEGGRVDVSLARRGRVVELRVTDTGQGIRSDFLPHVFAPFRQADGSSARRHGGLGLGLAICKHLVELHGGTVRAESAGESMGSTFVVELPLPRTRPTATPDADAPVGNTGSPNAMSRKSAGRLTGLRILAVEDDPVTLRALCVLLEGEGATVTTAASAEAATRALAAGRPDVLLCDIGLPGTDGAQFISGVRRKEVEAGLPRLPALAVSAFALDVDVRRALDAGFDNYLRKPVEAVELFAAILRLVTDAPT